MPPDPSPAASPPPPSSAAPPPASFKAAEDARLLRLALHRSPFFTCLDEEQVERFVAVAQRRDFRPGEIVILEGCVDGDPDEDDDYDKNDDDWEAEGGSREVHLQRQVSASQGPADADEISDSETSNDDESLEGDNVGTLNAREAAAEPESRSRPTGDVPEDSASEDQGDSFPNSPSSAAIKDDAKTSENHSQEPLSPQQQAQFTVQHHLTTVSADAGDTDVDDSPPPPRSGIPRALYIVRKGRADVWYNKARLNPISFGPGTCFGEGGFLFGRQHSASVVAHDGSGGGAPAEPLECWVVDIDSFRQHVLPSESMTLMFRRHAKRQDRRGRYYMTMDEFVEACHEEERGRQQDLLQRSDMDPLSSFRIVNMFNILSRRGSASTGKRGQDDARIYLSDFCLFHLLIARPDPEVDVAFLLMDRRQSGQIFLSDLERFLRPIFPQLDFESQFFYRYFGQDKSHSIRQAHFSQFLVDLQREMGKQAFLQAVDERGREGCLEPRDFIHVIRASCGWRLPQGVVDRLENIFCNTPIQAGEAAAELSIRSGSYRGASVKEVAKSTEDTVLGDMTQREKQLGTHYFNYADFLAFQEVLALLPGICNLIDRAQSIKKGPISPDDFKVANKVIGLGGRLSRLQVDIIFSMFDLDRDGFVAHEDTVSVCGIDFAQRLAPEVGRGGALTFAPPPQFRHEPIVQESENDKAISRESFGHFSLSALAGAFGVVALYPLDLIKTRLMNQRLKPDGSRMYATSLDCFRQVLRHHGAAGLYRGLTPQLLGSAPEKAIKLHVNDLMMNTFKSMNGGESVNQGNLLVESLAGACAGACQLLVSNPMELSKTRLILQDETSQILKAKNIEPPRTLSFTGVVRDLGFPQIQVHGATACLLRDIPFSAIYFPGYAACKRYLAGNRPDGRATLSDLLIAGTLAAVPSALITTPCDVIRVRLQAVPRPGETVYAGIRDCATQIYRREGAVAFFQGALPRVLRIAPQFGIALLAYEQLTHGLGFPSASRPPTNAPVDPRDYRTAFPTAATIQPKATDVDGWMRSIGLKPPSGPEGQK